MTRDRASAVARALIDTLAECLRDDRRLHARTVEQLCDEFADIKRETLNEIRLEADESPDISGN
jgi:hypothetical protein